MFGFPKKKKSKNDDARILSYYKALQESMLEIIEVRNFEETTQKVVDLIVNKFGYSAGVLFYYDKPRKFLYSHTVSNTKIVSLVTNQYAKSFRDHGINVETDQVDYYVFKTFKEKKVYMGDTLSDFVSPTLPKNLADLTQKFLRIKQIITLPVMVNDEILGVLMFTSYKDHFDELELEVLQSFTKQIGLSIKNSLLYSQLESNLSTVQTKNKELNTIFRITNQIVTTLDPFEVAQRAVDLIPTEMGYFGGIVTEFDQEKNTLIPIAVTKTDFEEKIRKIIKKDYREFAFNVNDATNQNQLNTQALKTDKYQISNKFSDAVSPPLSEEMATAIQKLIGIKAVVAFPIKARNKLWGTVTYVLKEKETKDLRQEDFDLMRTFAFQIGIALENAQLFKNSKQLYESLQQQNDALETKNQELDTIFRITNQVITTLDPDKVAQRAVNTVRKELGYLGAMIAKIDNSNNTIQVLSITESLFSPEITKKLLDLGHIKHFEIKKIHALESIIYKKGNFALSEDMVEATSPLIPEPLAKRLQDELGIKSIVSVPLQTRTEVNGIVSFFLNHKSNDQLNTVDFDLMQTFASQIAIGLENAKLFNESQELSRSLTTKNRQLEEYAQKEKDILDIMGHELRTPITIVRNSLSFLNSLIKRQDIDKDKVRHYIDIANRSTKREINIIETMLAATKVEAKKIQLYRKNVDPKEVIDEAIEGQKQNIAEKNLELKIHIQPYIPKIYADRSRIQEIMDNLLSNAVKYTKKGQIIIEAYSENEEVRFNVIDTGEGIPENDLNRLGTKFYRVSQHIDESSRLYNVVRPGGTGLGLYVTFNLIKLHGGNIRVVSKINEGSKFSFTIPAYSDQPIEASEFRSRDLLVEHRKKKKK